MSLLFKPGDNKIIQRNINNKICFVIENGLLLLRRSQLSMPDGKGHIFTNNSIYAVNDITLAALRNLLLKRGYLESLYDYTECDYSTVRLNYLNSMLRSYSAYFVKIDSENYATICSRDNNGKAKEIIKTKFPIITHLQIGNKLFLFGNKREYVYFNPSTGLLTEDRLVENKIDKKYANINSLYVNNRIYFYATFDDSDEDRQHIRIYDIVSKKWDKIVLSFVPYVLFNIGDDVLAISEQFSFYYIQFNEGKYIESQTELEIPEDFRKTNMHIVSALSDGTSIYVVAGYNYVSFGIFRYNDNGWDRSIPIGTNGLDLYYDSTGYITRNFNTRLYMIGYERTGSPITCVITDSLIPEDKSLYASPGRERLYILSSE